MAVNKVLIDWQYSWLLEQCVKSCFVRLQKKFSSDGDAISQHEQKLMEANKKVNLIVIHSACMQQCLTYTNLQFSATCLFSACY